MRKIIFLLLSTLAITACQHDKKDIEFKKFANLDLGNLTKDNATLKATAVFMNLTAEQCTLKDVVLDFTIDGKDVGTVVTKTNKVIQPNSEFSVPIQYSYETKAFIEVGHDPANTYAVTLIGDLTTINAKGNEVSTPVKYALTYEYLTKKEIRVERREERRQKRQDRKAEKNQ